MKKLTVLVLTIIVMSIVLSACGSKSVTLDVDMKDFTFTPADLTVPAGAEVTVNLVNSGTVEHEMVIMLLGKEATAPFDDDDEGNIYWEAELEPGMEETVTFTAPSEPGTYQLVCGTPTHLELGMVGTLTVK